MFQRIIGSVLLIIGLIYAAVLLLAFIKDREATLGAKGDFKLLAPLEFLVFVCASVGVSDYLLNTLIARHFHLTEDEELPGTLISCCLLPGTIIAFSLMRADNPVDMKTLILCSICVVIGSLIGSHIVMQMDGRLIRRIMCVALMVSLAFVIVKMIAQAGQTGTEAGAAGIRLAVAAVLCLATGIINRFGIPMKPTWTAIFLILGLSPLATLTMTLIIGALTPIAGGISVMKSGLYQKKMTLAALIFGSIGAIIGTTLAISIPALTLNVILIIVMVIAILSMIRS